MWVEIVFSLLLASLVGAYYRLVVRPRKLMKWYANMFESMGFRVKLHEHKLAESTFVTRGAKYAAEKGDSLYFEKNQLQNYDLEICNILYYPTISLVNPDLLKQFFLPENTHSHEKVPFIVENFQRSLGHGIAFSQGQQWKKKRKIMNNVFNYEFIQSIIPDIIRLCNQSLDKVEKQHLQKSENKDSKVIQIDVIDVAAETVSGVMLECFFGCGFTERRLDGKTILQFVSDLNSQISKQTYDTVGIIFGAKFFKLGLREKDRDLNRRSKMIHDFGMQTITKRMEQIEAKGGVTSKKPDIIEALYQANSLSRDASNKETYSLSDVTDEFLTFYAAGSDTTSNYLRMMIYIISTHPEVERKLREEVAKYIKSDEDITSANLKNLVYIDWIENETTRFYGPGNGIFLRQVTKDYYLNRIPIKKGTVLTFQPVGNHYNPKYYEKPHQFRPERWETECKNLPPFVFLGFSAGPRNCIGKHLALLQSKIFLIKFIQKFKSFKLPKQNFTWQSKFITEPEPMKLKVQLF